MNNKFWGENSIKYKIKVIFYHLTMSQLEEANCSELIHNTQKSFIIVNYLPNVFGITILYK